MLHVVFNQKGGVGNSSRYLLGSDAPAEQSLSMIFWDPSHKRTQEFIALHDSPLQ